MPIGDLLRYTFIALVFFVLLGFGMRWRGKRQTEEQITRDLQSLVSTTSSFGQFYEAGAKKSLYQSIHQLHLGEKKLGLTPRALLDLVFEVRKEGGMFDHSDPYETRRRDPAESLIRTSLLRNYENSKRLGLFDDSLSLEAIARGEAPQIHTGPASGKTATVGFIISPEVSPGIEKIIPNLVIRPPATEESQLTEFEIAQAKVLANALHDAELLERKARDRIIAHYDHIGEEPEPPEEDQD